MSEAGFAGLDDGGGGDVANRVGDEDEGDDGVADVVFSFHIGD